MSSFVRIESPWGHGFIELSAEDRASHNRGTRSPALPRWNGHWLPEFSRPTGRLAPYDLLKIGRTMVVVHAAPTWRLWDAWCDGALALRDEDHARLAGDSGVAFPWEAFAAALEVGGWMRAGDAKAHRAITRHLDAIARNQIKTRWGVTPETAIVAAVLAVARGDWRFMDVFTRGRRMPPRDDAAFEALRLGSNIRFRAAFRQDLAEPPHQPLVDIEPYWAPPVVRPYVVDTDNPARGVSRYVALVLAVRAELGAGRDVALVAHRCGLSEPKIGMVVEDARLLAGAAA